MVIYTPWQCHQVRNEYLIGNWRLQVRIVLHEPWFPLSDFYCRSPIRHVAGKYNIETASISAPRAYNTVVAKLLWIYPVF